MGEYKYKYILCGKKSTNTNTNMFGLTKKGEYVYKYEYLDWYLLIWIQICVTHCYTVQYSVIQYSKVQYSKVHYRIEQYITVQSTTGGNLA